MPDHFSHKYIRDPLYGFINLSEEETKLIDLEMFQRLQRIKQLSHAYVVYPSSVHTRFEHSLGTIHVAGRMCSMLDLSFEDTRSVRISALLHDVGHGPFSHLFEHVLKKINPAIPEIHEVISRSIIHTDSQLDAVLKNEKNNVIDILEKNKHDISLGLQQSLHSDIVSGTLDADKFDYLRRDSYHAGVAYGQFDLERILHTLTVSSGTRLQLCVTEKGIDAIENYRIARYLMHAQVYEHHARLIADRMFLNALDIAIHDENIINSNDLKISENDHDANIDFLKFYQTLDDNSIYNLIINNPASHVSKEILLNIKKRKLLKRVCQFTPNYIDDPWAKNDILRMTQSDLDKISQTVASDLDIPKHDLIFYLSNINIKLYRDGDIVFLDKKGQPHDIKESSPINAAKSVLRYYVFGPEDHDIQKKIILKISEELGVSPEKINMS